MPEPSSARIVKWLAILLGWLLLLGLLSLCHRDDLRPDFLLEMVSGNLMC
ncbi:hypothetical protein LT85_0094 [Collimonas arenae]|uniref:Uncharacterized protein n=1 Tax=Collimonas arenae TaxID=279058 RepID=A0A0A1F6H1_9BURK|nr:hypothetical protein LT85_0094 [Collimonas arenae]